MKKAGEGNRIAAMEAKIVRSTSDKQVDTGESPTNELARMISLSANPRVKAEA